MPGDYVRAIDGEPTRLLSVIEGQQRLHGEPGTTVTLSLIRGSTQEPYDIALVRERLAPTAVSGRLLEEADGVGYVRVPTFDEGVAAGIADEIATLEAGGASHLVIDVRNAAEGTYEAAGQSGRAVRGGRDAGHPRGARRHAHTARGDGRRGTPSGCRSRC